jgi:hypothetical protein
MKRPFHLDLFHLNLGQSLSALRRFVTGSDQANIFRWLNPQILNLSYVGTEPEPKPKLAFLSPHHTGRFWCEVTNHQQEFRNLGEMKVSIFPYPILVSGPYQHDEFLGIKVRHVILEHVENPLPPLQYLASNLPSMFAVRITRCQPSIGSCGVRFGWAISAIGQMTEVTVAIFGFARNVTNFLSTNLTSSPWSGIYGRSKRLATKPRNVLLGVNLKPSYWIRSEIHGESFNTVSLTRDLGAWFGQDPHPVQSYREGFPTQFSVMGFTK